VEAQAKKGGASARVSIALMELPLSCELTRKESGREMMG
jgi:hypothetical protein